MLDDFGDDPARERFFYVGLSTFLSTVIVSSAFWWLLEVSHQSENHMLLLLLANAVVCTINEAPVHHAYLVIP